jgi:cell division septum initiation protein DivIVA
VKESKGKSEKAAEGSLEPVLDAIETRVEALVEVVRGLAAENARLRSEVASAKAKADEGGEAAMLLARYEDERNAVRERVERVLKTLEEGAGAGKA